MLKNPACVVSRKTMHLNKGNNISEIEQTISAFITFYCIQNKLVSVEIF